MVGGVLWNPLSFLLKDSIQSNSQTSKESSFGRYQLVKNRRAKDRPNPFLTITFGLSYRKESARIDISTEPYPNRWTHHVMIGTEEEIDEELISWIQEAVDFADRK